MPAFELEVDEELAAEVRRLAARLRISPEEFVTRAIRIFLAERADERREYPDPGARN